MGRIELSRLFDVLLNRCAQILFLKGHRKGTGKVFVRSMPVVLLGVPSEICIKKHQGGFLSLEAKDIFLKNGPPMEFLFLFWVWGHIFFLKIYIQWLHN